MSEIDDLRVGDSAGDEGDMCFSVCRLARTYSLAMRMTRLILLNYCLFLPFALR